MAAKLSTIGGLVRTIVPQANAVAVFDSGARVIWATDGEDHEDLRQLATDLMAGADPEGPTYSMRCTHDAAASYGFVLRRRGGEVAGVLTLTVGGPYRRGALLLPALLEKRLRPLLMAAAQARPDTIERLISALAAKINADAIIVSVPERKFEHRFSPPASPLEDLEGLHKLVNRGEASRADCDDRPFRIGSARTAANPTAFSYVTVPLRRRRALVGVLAAFASHPRRAFSAQETELVKSSAARLVRLLS